MTYLRHLHPVKRALPYVLCALGWLGAPACSDDDDSNRARPSTGGTGGGGTGGGTGGGGTGGKATGGAGGSGGSGGSQPDSSTTGGTGGASGDGGSAGVAGADAGQDVAVDGVYVDPQNGLDTNDGTLASPFKTITKAAASVTSGQSVNLLDGTYDIASQTSLDVTFPVTTFVQCADITFKGGTIDKITSVPVTAAFVRGAGKLAVDGLTIKDLPGHAFVLVDNGSLVLKNVVIQGSGLGTSSGTDRAVILMGGQNTQSPLTESLELDNTEISDGTGPGIALTLYGSIPSTPKLKFTNSHVDRNVQGGLVYASGAVFDAGLTVTLDAVGSTFNGNQGPGIELPRATLTMTGGEVSNNTGAGIRLSHAPSKNTLTIRDTAFAGNQGDAIRFEGSATSVLDLGKSGDAGGLVFTAVPAAGAAAVNLLAPIAGSAIGNTWMPSIQGANASGKYPAINVIGGPATGRNVTLAAGASLAVGGS
jgi:hypothetical protein